MKKAIESSEAATSAKIIRYDVEVQFVSECLTASKPLLKEDGTIDQAAMAEYEEFVLNTAAVLDEHEFVILEEREIPGNETSYCISAYKQTDSAAEDIKCVFFIRASAGDKSETDCPKKPVSKQKRVWRLQSIVVNGEAFDSYDDALDGIGKKLIGSKG